MVVAILADVHANSEALASCLAHARRGGAERFVFLGDHVGYGADPSAVVDTIRELVERGVAAAVVGNHDLAAARMETGEMHEEARRAIAWTRAQLTSPQLEFLRGLPLRMEEGGRLYVHANAWSPAGWEYISGAFDAGRSLRATSCRWTFCGHVHTAALYHMADDGRVAAFTPTPAAPVPLTASRRWLAIPGSVGQPRDGNPAAGYALLDEARSVLTWFRVPYDTRAAARKIVVAGLPESFGARLEAGL